MKSERRRELKSNPLAVWLARAWQQVQPYWRVVAAGVVVVVVAWLGMLIWRARQESYQLQSWDQLAAVANARYLDQLVEQLRKNEATRDLRPEELRREAMKQQIEQILQVAQSHPSSSVQLAAWLMAADMSYALGISYLFHDVRTAREHFNRAIEGYQRVLHTPGLPDPYLLARARFGLAQAYEARGRQAHGDEPHDWELAHQQYEVLTRSPSPFHAMAQARLDAMERSLVHEWLWDKLPSSP